MPSLKDLKNRISSVKSTRKITSAMKMVAGSKLRRAQERAVSSRPYAQRMARMLSSLAENLSPENTPRILSGTGQDKTVLLLILTSDRGLCGAFNSAVVRETRRLIHQYETEGKMVKLFCVGRKGRDLLRRDHASKIVHALEEVGRRSLSYDDAVSVKEKILAMFEAGEFDVCHVVFNQFKSAISQVVTVKQLVPFAIDKEAEQDDMALHSLWAFEPSEKEILEVLLPRALAVTVFGVLLENAAGEQGARMTAMDNATRNAGEMINKLTLNYNRSRQAYITKELIEIISGAEAL